MNKCEELSLKIGNNLCLDSIFPHGEVLLPFLFAFSFEGLLMIGETAADGPGLLWPKIEW